MGEEVTGKEKCLTFVVSEKVKTPKLKLKSIIKDKQEVEWICKLSKEEFDRQKDTYIIEVYDDKKVFIKKYMKAFLTFIREL